MNQKYHHYKLAAISDRRLSIWGGFKITSYLPEILMRSDYYPFGAQMPGRKARDVFVPHPYATITTADVYRNAVISFFMNHDKKDYEPVGEAETKVVFFFPIKLYLLK